MNLSGGNFEFRPHLLPLFQKELWSFLLVNAFQKIDAGSALFMTYSI